MDNFNYSIYIPSLKSKKRFKQLNNRDHKTIAKFIENNDDEYLHVYFLDLINRLCIDSINISELTNQDIICILVAIRNICIGSSIELIHESEKGNVTIKLDITKTLNDISNITFNPEIITVDNIDVKPKLASNLLDIQLHDFIDTISIDSSIYKLQDIKPTLRKNILDLLPAKVYAGIEKQLSNIQIVNVFNIDNTPKTTISLIDNSGFSFIKLIYTTSLQSMYDVYYLLATKLHFDLEYLDNCVPIEIEIFLNQYKSEQEAIKEAQSQQSGPSITPGASPSQNAVPGGFKF